MSDDMDMPEMAVYGSPDYCMGCDAERAAFEVIDDRENVGGTFELCARCTDEEQRNALALGISKHLTIRPLVAGNANGGGRGESDGMAGSISATALTNQPL